MEIREPGRVFARPTPAQAPPREHGPVDALGPSVMDAPLQSFLADREALVSEGDRLKAQAARVDDPIAARMAQELLQANYDRLSWPGRLELMGTEQAVTEKLAQASDGINLSPEPAKMELEPALALLSKDHANPTVLDAVLRLARGLPESPQRAMCRQQVQSWVQSGALKLEGGTDPLAPGLVVGDRLLLTPLPAATREVLAGIPMPDAVGGQPEPAPGLDRLAQLARDNPALARSVVTDLVARDLDAKTHRQLVQLMSRAVGDEALKGLLEPHLDRLTDYGTRAEEHGQIHRRWGDNQFQGAHYDLLTQLFPQTLNANLAVQLTPFLMNFMTPRLGAAELIERNPVLVKPVLAELVRQHPSRPLPERTLAMLRNLAEKGWRPTEHEQDWLASRLYQPQWRDDSLWSMPGARAKEFAHTLDILRAAETGRDRKLPDKDGNWVDLPTYAVNRVLDDPDFVKPEAVATRLFEGSGEIVSALYLFSPPQEHQERVFELVRDGLAHPRSKYSVENRVTTGLGLLAHLARHDPELRERLVELVRDVDSIYLTGMGSIVGPLRYESSLRDLEAGRLAEGVTPESLTNWLVSRPKDAAWDSSEVPALMERAEVAWTKLQRSHYAGEWPARAADLEVPGPTARAAVARIRADFPEPEQAGAWSRLESMVAQLGDNPSDPDERMKMAFEMLDTQQAYLSPGATSLHVSGDRVQIGSVNLRARRRS